MLKPLSEKTLKRKYEELGLSVEKTDLLHDYFLCFSNLYGVITVDEAWSIFRNYEGLGYIKKKEFYAFSGIAQREVQPYKIVEIREVYSEEEKTPGDRMIINSFLLLSGYYKFRAVWDLENEIGDKPFYIPEKKSEFFKFREDTFWGNKFGKELRELIENLKTTGMRTVLKDGSKAPITDLDGNEVKGKKLKDFRFYTNTEQLEINYEKRPGTKQRLIESFNQTASEKILYYIKRFIMAGSFSSSPGGDIQFITRELCEETGAELTKKQLNDLINLYMNLSNSSNRWINCGWTPVDLHSYMGGGLPEAMSFGPEIRKMVAEGSLDKNKINSFLESKGITPIWD